jgi:hypothetical protein
MVGMDSVGSFHQFTHISAKDTHPDMIESSLSYSIEEYIPTTI